jgi:peptide methionine sulfoxide reductase MsrB
MCSLHMMYVEDEPIKAYAQRYGVNKSSLTLISFTKRVETLS